MDRNVRRLLNRVSVVFATIATASLFHLFHHSSLTCFSSSSSMLYSHLTLSRSPFPKSSCDAFSRRVAAPETRFAKLRSSRSYLRRVHSLSGSVFDQIRSLHLLSNSSHVLCVSAGAGHAVDALQNSGVMDVTGVDLIDYPPLVKRADPHNLPFFDDVFDLGFSDGLAGALYPVRFVSELERTVRRGGAVVLVVATKVAKVDEVAGLFKRLNLLEVRSVNLDGSKMNLIIMKNNGTKSSWQGRSERTCNPFARCDLAPSTSQSRPTHQRNLKIVEGFQILLFLTMARLVEERRKLRDEKLEAEERPKVVTPVGEKEAG